MRSILTIAAILLTTSAGADTCVDCHRTLHPGVVDDWKASEHASANVACADCHGTEHDGPENPELARLPESTTCGNCHVDRLLEYRAGKHGAAWVATQVMPNAHGGLRPGGEDARACGDCHGIGTKPLAVIEELEQAGVRYGRASCDACHTRHLFSVEEARSPQACRSCHSGQDHPQWEMYASSKHGVRSDLIANGLVSGDAAAPTCQSCHMQNGTHEVRSAWGFYGVRWPVVEDDPDWAEDQRTILRALGMIDQAGEPTLRFEAAKVIDLFRMDAASFQRERDRIAEACASCHARDRVDLELTAADDALRRADAVMAEALRTVAGLYEDGILGAPEDEFPDLLALGEDSLAIEHRLWKMFSTRRARAFMGAFHQSPDHAHWQGWASMHEDLAVIRDMARALRAAPSP